MQHYFFPTFFHSKFQKFILQLCYDFRKKVICNENGIFLIIFPYSVDPQMKNNKKIQSHITSEIQHLNILKFPLTQIPNFNHLDLY